MSEWFNNLTHWLEKSDDIVEHNNHKKTCFTDYYYNLNIMVIGDDVLQGIKFVKSLRICKLKKQMKNSLTHCDSLPYE